MEALLLLLDAVAVIVLVVAGRRDDRRAPGAAPTGLFRFADAPTPLRRRKPAHGGRRSR